MTDVQTIAAPQVPARPWLHYQRIEAVETLTLPVDRPGWKGGPLAEIRLGQHGGQWAFATSFQQQGGDYWGGGGGGLGFWNTQPNPHFSSTREAALQAAIADLRATFARRPVEMAQHLAWLDTLIPDQLDLFSFAA